MTVQRIKLSVRKCTKHLLTHLKKQIQHEEITELDLFNLDLPYFGNTAIMRCYKRSQGMELTAEEAKAADIKNNT